MFRKVKIAMLALFICMVSAGVCNAREFKASNEKDTVKVEGIVVKNESGKFDIDFNLLVAYSDGRFPGPSPESMSLYISFRWDWFNHHQEHNDDEKFGKVNIEITDIESYENTIISNEGDVISVVLKYLSDFYGNGLPEMYSGEITVIKDMSEKELVF